MLGSSVVNCSEVHCIHLDFFSPFNSVLLPLSTQRQGFSLVAIQFVIFKDCVI